MKSFLQNIWKYLCFLFAGIVAGWVAAMKLLDPSTTVNGTYVKEQRQDTKIGTVKQKKGTGNVQDVDQAPQYSAASSRKEKREQRKVKRKSRRAKKKGVLSDTEEKGDV